MIYAMIAGIPNVGKSTLINRLAERKIAKTGNEAALTRMQQRIEISPELTLIVSLPPFARSVVRISRSKPVVSAITSPLSPMTISLVFLGLLATGCSDSDDPIPTPLNDALTALLALADAPD